MAGTGGGGSAATGRPDAAPGDRTRRPDPALTEGNREAPLASPADGVPLTVGCRQGFSGPGCRQGFSGSGYRQAFSAASSAAGRSTVRPASVIAVLRAVRQARTVPGFASGP